MSDAPTVPVTFLDAQERLARSLPGYEERPQQERLAREIEQSWQDGTILIGQAGTGVGKSLAGLIPAILRGGRVVYSTATKALQSQLMNKDLPFLDEHLGVEFRYAMLQGKSNYFCHAQAVDNAKDNPLIADTLSYFTADDDEHAVAGDWQFEMDGLRENLPVDVDNVSWGKMTISADECPRKGCAFYEVCRFESARHKAWAANVVVANHALVALDGVISAKTEGNVNLLGDFEQLIVDECHDLEGFLTNALTTRQTVATYKATTSELRHLMHLGVFQDDHVNAVEKQCLDIIVAAEVMFDAFPVGRVRHRDAVNNADPFVTLINELDVVATILGFYSEQDQWGGFPYEQFEPKVKTRYSRMCNRIDNLIGGLRSFLLRPDSEVVRLFEAEFRPGGQSVKALKVIPVRVGQWAADNLWSRVTPTLLSATALVDGKATFLIDQLGLDLTEEGPEGVTTIDVVSPFDYDRQARLYIPEHITEPNPKGRVRWEAEMLPLMEELVSISRGRALLLFTSRTQMEAAWSAFAHKLKYPARKQGDASVALLTRWFREETDSVLFATRSFFQGIDIQGESLSLVVIDKLPFPVPSDPLVQARSEDINARGGNDFADLSIPTMTLILQQAFGRLIRT